MSCYIGEMIVQNLRMMLRTVTSFIAFFLLLLCSRCSTDPIIVDDNLKGDLYVLGILSTGAPYQEVRIFESRPLLQAKGIDNAEVAITSQAATYRLNHIGDGVYRDMGEKIPVLSGASYSLHIQIPEHEKITAQTTVPQALAILAPSNGDTLFLEPDSMSDQYFQGQVFCSWEKATGAWISQYFHKTVTNNEWSSNYSVCLAHGSTFQSSIGYHRLARYELRALKIFISQSDSVLSTYSLIQDFYAFTCNGFDDLRDSESYETFFRLRNDLRQKYPNETVNVQGAKGVFGSVVVDSVEIAIKIRGEE
ncbi:MAG: DUF4249 family protein [bacterium]